LDVAKNFVIRLKCPYGDQDQLVMLQDRPETLKQILDTPWDFECPVHGVQREIPVEASEKPPLGSSSRIPRKEPTPANRAAVRPRSGKRISLRVPISLYGWSRDDISFHEDASTLLVNDSGALVEFGTRVALGATMFVVNRATQQEQECRVAYVGPEVQGKLRVGVAFKRPAPYFWRITRKELRVVKTFQVTVRGVDRNRNPFSQTAHAVDISRHGARLDGIGFLTSPGEIVEVRRHWRKVRYRVVWVGQIGTPQAGQAGMFCLELGKNIWGGPLP
jgi:hypothetical protein